MRNVDPFGTQPPTRTILAQSFVRDDARKKASRSDGMILVAEMLRQMASEAEHSDAVASIVNYLVVFADALDARGGAAHTDGLRALSQADARHLYARGCSARIAFDGDASWRHKFGLCDAVYSRDNVFACVASFAINSIVDRVSRLAREARVSITYAETIVKNAPRISSWINRELRRRGSAYVLRQDPRTHYFRAHRAW